MSIVFGHQFWLQAVLRLHSGFVPSDPKNLLAPCLIGKRTICARDPQQQPSQSCCCCRCCSCTVCVLQFAAVAVLEVPFLDGLHTVCGRQPPLLLLLPPQFACVAVVGMPLLEALQQRVTLACPSPSPCCCCCPCIAVCSRGCAGCAFLGYTKHHARPFPAPHHQGAQRVGGPTQ
jgi:hypothetical protein